MSNFSLQVETALVYLSGCISLLLRNTLVQSLWAARGQITEWRLFWLDLCTVVLPAFLAQTFMADYLPFCIFSQCALAAVAFTLCGARAGVTPLRALRPLRVDSARGLRDSQTMFRALLLITTAIAILAVDFSLLPRRMAKTHYYGQSLMDTGTAAFVFVNALADQSAEARGFSPGQRTRKATMNLFFIRIPTFLVLFLLGIGRSVFIQISGYGQDVTEYGVHWNFFVTLFFIRIFVVVVPSQAIVPLGFALGIGYQLALSFTGLEHWMLETLRERHGFVDQNREGIFSMFGYFFIYAGSLQFARFCSDFVQKDKKLSPVRIMFLFGASLLCYGIERILEDVSGLQASRRLCNLPYCLAMIALCTATQAFLMFIQIAVPLPQSKGGLVEAISRNALLHFLVANLLTGFVNIFMHFVVKIRGTLAETGVMAAYSVLTSLLIFALYLHKKRSQQ